jgi:hypothetical protein
LEEAEAPTPLERVLLLLLLLLLLLTLAGQLGGAHCARRKWIPADYRTGAGSCEKKSDRVRLSQTRLSAIDSYGVSFSIGNSYYLFPHGLFSINISLPALLMRDALIDYPSALVRTRHAIIKIFPSSICHLATINCKRAGV